MAAKRLNKIMQRGASIPSQDPKKRHLAPVWLKVEQSDAFSIGFRVLGSALGRRHLRPWHLLPKGELEGKVQITLGKREGENSCVCSSLLCEFKQLSSSVCASFEV